MRMRLRPQGKRILKIAWQEVLIGLVIPMAIGVLGFVIFWFLDSRLASLPRELFVIQLLGLVVAAIVYYVFLVYYIVTRPTRKYKQLQENEQARNVIRRSTESLDLCATSTIPLEDWFTEPILDALINEVIHCSAGNANHVRILLFDDNDLDHLRSAVNSDGQLARRLAEFHKLAGIELYFLRKGDLDVALKAQLTDDQLNQLMLKPNGLAEGSYWKRRLDFGIYTNSHGEREVASFDLFAQEELRASTEKGRVDRIQAAFDAIESMCIDSKTNEVKKEAIFRDFVLNL